MANNEEITPERWEELTALIARPFKEVGLVCLRGLGHFETQFNIAHKVKYHSPTGMEWGYRGSGPSDLALNVICELVKAKGNTTKVGHNRVPRLAVLLYVELRDKFIAPIPSYGGHVPIEELISFVRERAAYWNEVIELKNEPQVNG